MLVSIDPATEIVLKEYPEHSPREVEQRLVAARRAFAAWSTRSIAERGLVLHEAAGILDRDAKHHASLITSEMGKPTREARAEVQKCATALRYAAQNAEASLAPRELDARCTIVHEPLGTILGVMPWNFPYWQAVRFLAPALMAGNVALVKHASNVTGCLLALEDVLREANAQEAMQALLLSASHVERVIVDARIAGVSLTGSEAAGRAIGRAAGGALKPTVLELGGSDPFLVMRDADVASAAREASRARCVNGGQSCIAAKRFIVARDIIDDFTEHLVHEMRSLRVGDPTLEVTDVGPLARGDLRDAVHAQVTRSVAMGARVLTGGAARAGRGYYYEPTVMTQVTRSMPVMEEEVFGPVAPIVPFDDENEAVEIANATPYGLGASIWTRDAQKGCTLAPRIHAGMTFVNDQVRSSPERPFGGVKASGFGRELGDEGFRAFVNVRTIVG